MKRIIGMLMLATLLSGAQSAWSIVRERHDRVPRPVVESPFPDDAESTFAPRPFGSYPDDDKA